MISWDEIHAECGNYKAGFVAIFRKYEGQETDERTKQGHPVKVTMASFSRHMGIPEPTFRKWVADVKQTVSADQRAAMDVANLRRALRNVDPQTLERELSAHRAREPRELTVMDGLDFLSECEERLEWAIEVFNKRGRLIEDVKEAIGGFVDTFEMRVAELRALMNGGVSDAALREFIERSA